MKSRCSQGCALPEGARGKNLFLGFLLASGFASDPCLPWLVDMSSDLCPHPDKAFSLCVCLCVSSNKDTNRIGFKAYLP